MKAADKIPKNLSDAYMAGWKTRYKGGMRITGRTGAEFTAWMKGFDDCDKGSIDAVYALGPGLLVDGK